MIYYRPEYFRLYELVSRAQYKKWEHYKLWQRFDPRILAMADAIRVDFGPMVVNTWFHGGIHSRRGLRPFDSLTGATHSQHKFGRALDLVPVKASANEIRDRIISYPSDYRYITTVEMDVSWLHIDCRNWDVSKYGILQIKPSQKE